MLKSSARSVIRLRGVRQNNLKNFDLDLPLNQLIVITGLSGSGKSSLAFDTLFAEGQRRYIETFSPYARQFLALIAKQGYQRLLLDGEILRLDEAVSRITHHASRIISLTVIQDRLRATTANRARFVEACEQAYHFGKGKLAIREVPSTLHAPS